MRVKQIGNIMPTATRDNPNQGRVYDPSGLSPALNAMEGGGGREPMIAEVKCLNTKDENGNQPSQQDRVYDTNGVMTAITAELNGRFNILEKTIVASRGRNKDNPSDRTPGADVEQRLEPNSQGICNTIASVQKDNMVLEKTYEGGIYTEVSPAFQRGVAENISRCLKSEKHDAGVVENIRIKQATKEGYIDCKPGGVADLSFPDSQTRRGRVQDGGNTCPTLMACEQDLCRVETVTRIRKLMPLECWRLMDFTDEDFRKAEAVNSNSQLYKQAGNSIVKAVLMGIFSQLNIKGVVPWNDRR